MLQELSGGRETVAEDSVMWFLLYSENFLPSSQPGCFELEILWVLMPLFSSRITLQQYIFERIYIYKTVESSSILFVLI